MDGTYASNSAPIFVTGTQWGITVEHNPSGPASWSESRYKMANFGATGGQFGFDITTDDGGGGNDEDFNDFILTCAAPLSSSEWFLYGTVKTYKGFCWNPCFSGPYVAIDTAHQLADLLANASMRPIIEKLYPERVREALKPNPLPDPPPFRPMLIPTGSRGEPGLIVHGATELDVKNGAKSEAKSKSAAKVAQSIKVTTAAQTYAYADVSAPSVLTTADLLAVAKFKDWFLPICKVDRLGEAPLRFVEYDRTSTELAGGSYSGDGDRETLGLTFTDEFGNYVFRFTRSLAELLAEAADAAPGESVAVEVFPDVILQIMDTLPAGIAWESAPYYNIPNVKRLDLCIPESEIDTFEQPCQGGRAVQFLGDIAIFPNALSDLHSDGTVSNLPAAPGPTVQHAAWWATIAVVGCFEGTSTKVTQFTMEYWRPGDSDWSFVNENYDYFKIQPNGTGLLARVGPFDRALGSSGAVVPTYDNIEEDTGWAVGHRHRKLFLNTALYQPSSGLATFRIQGYDAANNLVAGAVDTFTLLIDNHLSTGTIEFVRLPGTTDPGDCALIDLPNNTAPLEVRYRMEDPEGFILSYGLGVTRGAGQNLPIAGSPIAGAYNDVAPFRYQGTTGFVTATVTPGPGETWLPPGHLFCAFSFHLSATDRLTNGRTTPSSRRKATELIGLALPPPP